MGFLNWWQNNRDDSDSQLDLFGSSTELARHERVDGATVNRDFTKAIKNSGGSDKAHPRAIRAETQELFDCGVNELYKATGGRKNDRSTLPKEAQKVYIVNESLSTHRLDGKEYRGSQRQKDEAIVEDVKDTATQVRRWLPW